MAALSPLRFSPIFRQYLWGGRRLESVLGKQIGEGNDYAESWELVDHGRDQSIVACGEMTGVSIHELVSQRRDAIFGRHANSVGESFPLLFKLLDAHQKLSVQVHPNDQQGAKLTPPDLGKTEAWVILHADPGSVIYAGLKRGFDRAALEREVHRGTTELCLNRIEPKAGDCIFIPAGVVHALGAGLLVAEIQQASDTTFRLFDWNRVGADGKPRALHIEAALETIRYDFGPVAPQVPEAMSNPAISRLVHCDKFVLNRWSFSGSEAVGGDNQFHLLCVTRGAVTVENDPAHRPLKVGETILLPAELAPTKLKAIGECELLEMHLP